MCILNLLSFLVFTNDESCHHSINDTGYVLLSAFLNYLCHNWFYQLYTFSFFIPLNYWTVYTLDQISSVCSGSLLKFNQFFSGS